MNNYITTDNDKDKVYKCVARVSDPTQVKALPAQKLNLQSYIDRQQQQWYDENYFEFNESAYKDDRQKFEELVNGFVEEARERYLAIVFDKIDRFTRDSRQALVSTLLNLVEDGKAELHFPGDGLVIDKDSPANDLMRFDIGTACARYYSKAIRDNVNRRFQEMLQSGKWISQAPLGYLNTAVVDDEDRAVNTIVIDDTRKHHIVKMFDLRISGYSYGAIAKIMRQDGLTTKVGKPITKTSVEIILHNPFYCGEMRCKSRNFVGAHFYGNIISRHVFDQAQAMNRPRQSTSRVHEFTRIAKCENCGTYLTPYTQKDYSYFRCNKCADGCNNKNITARRASDAVLTTIQHIDIPQDKLPDIVDVLQGRYDSDTASHKNNMESARSSYDKAKKALTNIGMKLAEESITQDEYDNLAPILRARMQEATKLLRKPRTGGERFEVTESYLLDLMGRLKAVYINSSDELRNKLLKFVTSNFSIDGETVKFEVIDLCKELVGLSQSYEKRASFDGKLTYGVANRT